MYDIHCHIMPGVDDGADSADDSLQMLLSAAKGGTKGIICTPHCNLQGLYLNYFDDAYRQNADKLLGIAKKNNIPVEIYFGQEIFLSGPIPRLLGEGKLITLNSSVYMLCEFDIYESGEDICGKLEYIKGAGYVPIVAHPERYEFVIREAEAVRLIKETGALLQISKDSLLGDFGSVVADTAHRLLSRRKADIVASDAHSPYSRTPFLGDVHELISEQYSFDYANHLLCDNPKRVVENKKIFEYG